ncbi:MAG: fused MFS/spermidine synthase [Planctomycetes bacterium]|nr:fused MFS/spermidine synthase [Planctomycetota bacterium]
MRTRQAVFSCNSTASPELDSRRAVQNIRLRSSDAGTTRPPGLSNMSSAVLAPPATALPIGRLAGVGLIIFFANSAMLVLQLVAGRLLAPFVGSSLETWTSVIGVFLTGIALGNGFGGRLADRFPTSRTLAILLFAGALTALWMVAFPTVLANTEIYKSIPLGPRIPLLALGLCLPAGFVLSLLTPLAIKLGLPDVSHTGRVAGMVFSLSTLGCLLGNYVTGFYLMKTFTVNELVFMSAGLLGVVSLGTFLFMKPEVPAVAVPGSPSPPSDSSTDKSPEPSKEWNPLEKAGTTINNLQRFSYEGGLIAMAVAVIWFVAGLWAGILFYAPPGLFFFGLIGVLGSRVDKFFDGPLDIRFAYMIVFCASFGGMCLELTASRVLAQFLGVSLFTWTGIIGVMLAGTALGNLTGGIVADRVNRPGETMWNPRIVLAGTLVSAGGAVILQFVTLAVFQRYGTFDNLGPISQVMAWTFSLFFLPMFLLGMVSPQVIRLAVPDLAHVGRVAGRVYAWSTTGAILGTFVAGYVLLSTIGMNQTLLTVGLILTLTSLLVARVWDHNVMLYLFSIVLGAVTGGFILTSRSGNRDDDLIVQLETNYYTIKVTHERVPEYDRNGKQVVDDKGRELSIRSGKLRLTLDHLLHSTVDPENPGYLHYAHEYVQMEFLRGARAENPRPRVLVIGGGGYTFPRYAMEMLPETSMDVVEIDPGVTKVAREHLGLKVYEGLDIVHMDGRQFIAEKVQPGTYDLVIQDAVNDLSVPSHLLTKEYNDAVKKAMKPTGVYLLTVIDVIEYGQIWKAAMHTLAQTYPKDNVGLLLPGELDPKAIGSRQVYVIYASEKPLDLDKLRIANREQLHTTEATSVLAMKIGMAVANVLAAPPINERALPFYTHQVEPEVLRPYLEAKPIIILTDQFAPTDNMMADVFRRRNDKTSETERKPQ